MLAATVALALCIPLIGVVFAARIMFFMNRFKGPKGGTKDKGGPPQRHSTSVGRNPYHLP